MSEGHRVAGIRNSIHTPSSRADPEALTQKKSALYGDAAEHWLFCRNSSLLKSLQIPTIELLLHAIQNVDQPAPG